MGLSSRKPFHAWHRNGADRRYDCGNATGQSIGRRWQALCLCLILQGFAFTEARAETLRIATYNVEMAAKGPGLTLQSLQRGDDPAQLAAVQVIVALNADVLLLTGFDYDLRGQALGVMADRLAAAGSAYPYHLALRPNTGVATGLDLDGNGRFGEPRDAQAFGLFAGQAGMAVLSRYPIDLGDIRDFSGFLWADLPGNLMLAETPQTQLLSTSGQYEVPVLLPGGGALRLLTWYASPPVFDGPEDRNGRRNHDETAFWLRLLAGDLPIAAPQTPFVLLGQSNLDPFDGEGRAEAIRTLLANPAVQDTAPRGNTQRNDDGQRGDPGLDTAYYPKLGGLRVEQVLPSADLRVVASGVMWPSGDDPIAKVLATASRHHPVWVDVTLP
jgi:hypothetical protein